MHFLKLILRLTIVRIGARRIRRVWEHWPAAGEGGGATSAMVIHDQKVEIVKHIKFLGAYITEDIKLGGGMNCTDIAKKARQRL